MATILYPTSSELSEIEQSLLPDLVQDDPIFQYFPMENQDADLIEWEQEDDYIGLQQVRGLNASTSKVSRVGQKKYQMQPGYYGEYLPIDEAELTRRRQIGTYNQVINVDDLIAKCQIQLLHRRLTRVKYIIWTLSTTGTFSVSLPNGGGVAHTDSYTMQTYTAVVPWATAATATPLANLRAVQLLSHGYSVNFGSTAKLFMNRATWNSFIGNLNAADLYGRRTQGLGTIENLSAVNSLLMGDDLPQIVIYDKGYKNDAGTWVNYLPNNTAVLFGEREDKQPLGAYTMTRHAANEGFAPGPFTEVVDSADHGQPIPRTLNLYDAHNGGPKIFYPSAIVIMTV